MTFYTPEMCYYLYNIGEKLQFILLIFGFLLIMSGIPLAVAKCTSEINEDNEYLLSAWKTALFIFAPLLFFFVFLIPPKPDEEILNKYREVQLLRLRAQEKALKAFIHEIPG